VYDWRNPRNLFFLLRMNIFLILFKKNYIEIRSDYIAKSMAVLDSTYQYDLIVLGPTRSRTQHLIEPCFDVESFYNQV
jgi:hypothetical protein